MCCMQCFLQSKYIKSRTFNDKNRWIIKKVMVFKKLLPHLVTRGTYSPGDWRCDEAWREQTLVYPPVMCQQRLIYCTWELNVMWRHREPFYLPYHEPALVIEWQGHKCSFLLGTKPLWHWRKWKSGPTSKRDPRPRYRPTGKCPLYRYETTGQPLHPEVGSNQVGCSCTWQRSLYILKPTLGPPKKFQCLTRAEEVVITRLRIGHTKATKSHILSRGPPTGCHHCGQTLTIDLMLLECALLQECRDEYYTVDALNALRYNSWDLHSGIPARSGILLSDMI